MDKPLATKEQIDALDEMNSIRVEISKLISRVEKINIIHRTREKSLIITKLEEVNHRVNDDIEINHKL